MVGGYQNIVSSHDNVVIGQRNEVTNSNNIVGGIGNTTATNYSLIIGQNNEGIGGNNTLAAGNGNKVRNHGSIAMGNSNDVGLGHSAASGIALGRNNIISTSGTIAIAIGQSNQCTNNGAMAFGWGNNVSNAGGSSGSAIAIGQTNTVTHNGALVLGHGATSTATNRMVANFAGGIHFNTAVTVSSDRRLKKNIENSSYGLEDVLKMSPKTYEYKQSNDETTNIGFIAQEMQEIVPEIIDTKGEYIQEQQVQIDALKAKNNQLTGQTVELENLKAEVASIKAMLAKNQTREEAPMVGEKE